MYRILIADSLPPNILEKYYHPGEIAIDNEAGISPEKLRKILAQYEGLVIRSRTQVTAGLLEQGSKLMVIGRAGAGVDNIDTVEATRRGIIVMNTPGGNTIAATEHTIALLLGALRNIAPANASIRQEKWDRKNYLGHELFEKTVGVIGLGKIGRSVARRLAAFGTKMLGYDPIMTQEMANRLGINLVSFEELLRKSDVITLHVPKIPETVNMINSEKLSLCKDGLVLVNCARGGLINEKDLLAALDSGKVAMAAIDVFETEPPTDWTLVKHPRVLATPHLGASTTEAQTKVADQILQQMVEYFRKKVAMHAVNFISLDEKILPIITPYFELAARLGAFFSQIRTARLKEVAIHFYGEVIELPSAPIASHLMAGALKSSGRTDDQSAYDVDLINMVNSLAIAEEKGIVIEISKKNQPLKSHTNLVACDFYTETGIIHISGTVYAKDIYRLVEFDKYDIDAELAQKMIVVENDDVPGIIGKVGTILGEDNINIGHVSSGRVKAHKMAVNIFTVEGDLNGNLKQRLEAIDHIKRVLLIDLEH